MKAYHITKETLPEAMHAARAIVSLFEKAVTTYGGFGRNLFSNEFNPFKYLRCELDLPANERSGLEVDLLRKGAAVSLLCHLLDMREIFGKHNLRRHILLRRIEAGMEEGLFDNLPLARDAALFACDDDGIFAIKLQLVYMEYILGYFEHALRRGDSEGGGY
jgi:hypothetical protein